MQFIDLKTQYQRIEQNVQDAIARVVSSQDYIMGPEIKELEGALATYAGVKYAVSCSSGTDALVIALMSYGLGKDDAVLVPSFTFFASAESITLAGGIPVFVDCDPRTFNSTAEDFKTAYEKVLAEGKLNPRGIIAVDLFGQLAEYEQISTFAKSKGLFLLEDAAQSFGAERLGQRACSFGDVAATSFFPAKPLGCYGDGGAIFTDDEQLAELFISMRVHGQGADKYDNVRIGLNGRLDTIQAAVLLEKLKIFDDEIARRNSIAASYTKRLQEVIKTPFVCEGSTSAWAQYSLLTQDAEQRERIIKVLGQRGIPTAVYYRVPIHLSAAYAHLGYQAGSLPICEEIAKRIVSLPMHPYLSEEDIAMIAQEVRNAL